MAALELFAAHGAVAGGIACACFGLGVGTAALGQRVREWVVMALAAHVILGMAGGLYERSALYDKLVHCGLSFAAARLVAEALALHTARNGLVLGARLERGVPVLAALALGTLWELFEFAADATGLVVAQRGLADTMLDLAADLAGAVAAFAIPRALPADACP
ncbi:MAG TPA: hypothetical protein VFT98_14085 [Myxococcota bacterium]|nr:hypothetical protein [Myxococcota bacterium]